MEAYCMKCKAKEEMKNPTPVTMIRDVKFYSLLVTALSDSAPKRDPESLV